MAYQQIAWQEFTFSGTVAGTPTDGLTVQSFVGGELSAYQPYQKDNDPVGQYRCQMASYEILGTSQTYTLTSETVGFDTAPVVVALTDPATLSTATQYCTVQQVYQLFGSENVNKWADLNNLRNTEEITRAIIDQIVQASDYVNAKMRDKYYAIPFAVPYPGQIVEITRIWTGTNLQVNRGIEDEDGTFNAMRAKAETLIKGILGKQIILNATGENEDPPAGSIPDAPSDGTQYVRRDANWTPNAVPKGGTIEQHLAKNSNNDYECDWVDAPPAFTETNLWQILTYDYDKRSNIVCTEVYQTIGQVITPTRPAGLYEVKFSISYTFADINDSAYARFRINGGDWFEFVSEPSDTTDREGRVYFFPTELAVAGIVQIELEMRKEDAAASTLTVDFADVVFQRVGGGTPSVNPLG